MPMPAEDHQPSPCVPPPQATPAQGAVRHKTVEVDGARIFYREAGDPGAPPLLLPHGYPCSSFQFRRLLPALADRWYLVAPDYPGFGLSDTPDWADFPYGFDGYARFLARFADTLGLRRYALYLHDYGSQIGLRLAISDPSRVAGLVIQNGDIYEDALGPKYAAIREHWRQPSAETRRVLEDAVSEQGFRAEFIGEIRPDHVDRVPPDLWTLHWPLMDTPLRRELAVRLMEGLQENLQWFPRYQAYLREHQPPTLIVWGPQDGYMPEASGRAYLRDLPHAQFHLTDGGHWLLETHLDEVVGQMRPFLSSLTW